MPVFTGQLRCFSENMEYVLNHWIWLGIGLVLILLEFFLPGLVVIFLGLGAVLTAGMLYTRVLTDAYLTVVFFTVASVFMLLTLRRIILFFYPAYSERSETDEDLLIAGQLAETITLVSADNFDGRVKYSGTTWPAKSDEGEIPAGTRVEILGRQNINLLVRRLAS